MVAGRGIPDWRSAAPYSALLRCDRHGFAWEWLRRSDAYRIASEKRFDDNRAAAAFGLHRFEQWERFAPSALPIWRSDVDPFVLAAMARPDSSGDAFDVESYSSMATCHVGSGGAEHWLFSDGWRQIRLDVVAGSIRGAPARLDYRISGLAKALPPVLALRRLVALSRTDRFIPSLFPPERRAARWALVLRVYDALAAGASHREIAAHLFGLGDAPRWRVDAPSYRRRVQRLAAAARFTEQRGPALWLRGDLA